MKKTTLFIAITAIGVGFTSCKKKGCTDPEALNYDSSAKKEDPDDPCIYEDVVVVDNSTIFAETVVGTDTIITITDRGEGVGNYTMCNDRTYVLNGFVFVNSGQTLTICPGTTIKGKSGQGENASALIVARGGMLNANGTAAEPIIMTSESDNGSLPNNARGLWGGLIVLGNAGLNSSPGETQIEGIPTTETRGLYGGTNDADNSGTITYVSIRHGGTDIGAGNEINGFTLGGVGSGTTISNIEIIANADDGIEFFGGTANIKHLVVSYCGDDAIDYDEGWRGKIQYALVYQDPNEGDRIGEHDGGTTPEDGAPYATPTFYNCTYIGKGIAAGNRLITMRDNAGGHYNNSIFMNQGKGIDIEDLASGEDSYARYLAGDLTIANNVFYDVVVAGTGAVASDLFTISLGSGQTETGQSATFQGDFASWGNTVADPGVTYSPLNPIPSNSANVSGGVASSDTWFDAVTYQGAFDPAGTNWASWTRLFN